MLGRVYSAAARVVVLPHDGGFGVFLRPSLANASGYLKAIPVLYWETDERLGALRKELRTRAMQQSPSPR